MLIVIVLMSNEGSCNDTGACQGFTEDQDKEKDKDSQDH